MQVDFVNVCNRMRDGVLCELRRAGRSDGRRLLESCTSDVANPCSDARNDWPRRLSGRPTSMLGRSSLGDPTQVAGRQSMCEGARGRTSDESSFEVLELDSAHASRSLSAIGATHAGAPRPHSR